MVKKAGAEARREIYNYILKYPGLHLSELSRKMNIPKSTINYHLNHLKKQEYIIKKPADKYTRYYIANNVGENEKQILHLLRQETPREIVIFLLLNHNSSQIRISKNLKKHPTTIAFHLNKLMNVDIVESIPNGNEINYSIKNEEYIFDLLGKYKDSFLDDTVDYILCSLLE